MITPSPSLYPYYNIHLHNHLDHLTIIYLFIIAIIMMMTTI